MVFTKVMCGRVGIRFVVMLFIGFLPMASFAAAPIGADDVVLVMKSTSVSIPMLFNDSDPDGDSLSVTGVATPAYGILVDNGDDSYTYTPTAAYVGDDQFTYTLSDGTNSATATVTMTVNEIIDGEAARNQILSGVTTIYSDGYTGRLAAYGPTAYAIANYPPDGGNSRGPYVAAATLGLGKVITIADHQGLQMDSWGGQGTTGQFYKNGIAWLTGSSSLDVNIVVYRAGNNTWLSGQGYTNVTTTDESGLVAALASADIFIGWLGSGEPQANLDALEAFVKRGKGLFIADFGDGYNIWWGKSVNQAPSNLLLRKAGLGFSAGLHRISGLLDVVANRSTGQINADVLFSMLVNASGYTEAQKKEGGFLLDVIYDPLESNSLLAAQLDKHYAPQINNINPTPAAPISNPFDKALLNREATLLEATAPAQVTAHRLAETLYYTTPNTAPRVTRTVAINTNRARYLPVGLYAAPGEVVTLTFPASLVGKGYKVRVNAHTDDIAPRESWERPPRVHRWFPIDTTTVEVANAFGGSLFIDVGGNNYSTAPNLGSVNITVANAIEQPYFVLGTHTDAEWAATIKNYPAPWAVFVSDYIILSFPKSDTASLTQPEALMTWWNQVGFLEDDLASRLEARTAAELMNIDRQISAGSAHAGYPYQAWDKYWGNVADYNDLLANGSWGDFHELGHNHQRGWWTFSGDGEITVNIFSNYVMETKNPNTNNGWKWTVDPIKVFERAVETAAESGAYTDKSANRLVFWLQLADEFGWDAYKTVFRTYEQDNATNPSALPTNQQQEYDEWFKRWSDQSGFNMKNFMVDTWNIPVTQSVVDAMASKPDWLPIMGKLTSATVASGHPVMLDIIGNVLSMDGVVNITAVSSPLSGTLVDNGNGLYTYTSTAGFVGSEMITYTLQSGAGNTKTFTLNIAVTPNAVPNATNDVAGTDKNTAVTIDVLNNDSDADGDTLFVSAITQGNSGVVINNNDGTLTYTPATGFEGVDSFTYTLNDGYGGTVTATVNVGVCGANTVVRSVADAGTCSLRWAVTQAVSGDTITFDSQISGQTIALASAVVIDKYLTINGGTLGMTLSGDSDQNGTADTQILTLNTSTNLTLERLNIVKGKSNEGALFVQWYAVATINNTTFANNENSYYGGGAIHAQGSLKINNSTFSGNSSSNGAGGAIKFGGSGTLIRNSTFINNSNGSIGGIYAGTAWSIYNTIIASANGVDCGGTAPTISVNNLVKDGSCSAALNGDPKLGVLQNNGGPTLTHKPQTDSSAIDAGDNAECADVATINNLDQRGESRPVDYDANGTEICDIGAVELGQDGDGDGIADSSQAYVSTFRNGAGRWLTYRNSGNRSQSSITTAAAPLTATADRYLLHGVVSMRISEMSNGETTMIDLFVPKETSITDYMMLGNDGKWYEMGATITHTGNKTKINFSVTEGGNFDTDGIADGVLNLAQGGAVMRTGFEISPYAHSFGLTELNTSTPNQTFTITNKGSRSLTFSSATVSGTYSNQFNIAADNCTSQTVAADASCTVDVNMQPTTVGSKSAWLEIASDDPDNSTTAAFLNNYESTDQQARRRLPPVLYSLAGLPETMTIGQSYTITWELLGYHENYLSAIVFFDCTGIAPPNCGNSYSSNFASSGILSPASTAVGEWSYKGVQSKRYSYSYTFTPTTAQFPAPADIVIRFYRKNGDDSAAGKGSLSLIIPGNLSDNYYDTSGRRIQKQVQ